MDGSLCEILGLDKPVNLVVEALVGSSGCESFHFGLLHNFEYGCIDIYFGMLMSFFGEVEVPHSCTCRWREVLAFIPHAPQGIHELNGSERRERVHYIQSS